MADPLLAHLVCPRCRRDTNRPSSLQRLSEALACRRCREKFPLSDDVPLIIRDPNWSMPPPNPTELALMEDYILAHYPELSASKRLARRLSINRRLQTWIERALSRHHRASGIALELGCGPGAYAPLWEQHVSYTILSDIRPAFAHCAHAYWSAVHPDRFGTIVCDAHDPPFRGESMSLVAAINLLDSTAEPWLLLGQIDALLQPGGIAVITMPFVANFHGPADLIAALQGQRPELPHLRYTILESKDWFPWLVPAGERLIHEYQVHALVARKTAPE